MILAVLIDGDDRPVCSEMRPGNTPMSAPSFQIDGYPGASTSRACAWSPIAERSFTEVFASLSQPHGLGRTGLCRVLALCAACGGSSSCETLGNWPGRSLVTKVALGGRAIKRAATRVKFSPCRSRSSSLPKQ